ncbi:MAG: hypothetical protein R2787_06065 [Saprospiraceae bacterium]
MSYTKVFRGRFVLHALILAVLAMAPWRVYAQDDQLSVAVLTDPRAWSDPFFSVLHKRVFDRVMKQDVSNLRFYQWDPEAHTVEYSPLNKQEEKPCRLAIFLLADFEFTLEPPLAIVRGEKGVISSVGLDLAPYGKYQVKIVDVATSLLLSKEVIDVIIKQSHVLPIKNYASVFGMDPDILKTKNPGKYKQILKNLHETNKDQIIAYYRKVIQDAFLYESQTVRVIFSKPNTVFRVVPEPGRTEEKAKTIQVYGGVHDNLYKGEAYDLYVQKEINGYPYYKDIGTYHIDEVGDSISTAKAWLSGNKDVGEALKNGEELLLVRYADRFTAKMLNHDPKIPRVNIALRTDCWACESMVDDKLFSSPAFNIVERQSPELIYFGQLLKDDRFIDYSVEDFQGKRLGYELLISPEVKYCQVIDVRTNTNILSLTYNKRLVNNVAVPYLKQSDLHDILSAYNPELYVAQWVQTLKEKKDKIEEIAIYHPAGMVRYMDFDLSVETLEEIDGEKHARREPIASGRVGETISSNISKLKIKKGEKELYSARQKGQKIVITVSEDSMY